MTEDALGAGRLIGMIQPRRPDDAAAVPELYDVGCAGRIRQFAETEDGRFLITLTGVCRFAVAEEIRSEEHTSALQSLMRISYAVFCLKKKKKDNNLHKLIS